MRHVLFLIALSLYGQKGLVTLKAGMLNCGVVMRASDQIQRYCYGPGGVKLVLNTLETIYTKAELNYEWCIDPLPSDTCSYTIISYWFQILPTGAIAYQYSVNLSPIVAGTLTGIYGTTGCLPLKLPWTGVAIDWDGNKVPAMIYGSGTNQCRSWLDKTTNIWLSECGQTLINTFQVCGE